MRIAFLEQSNGLGFFAGWLASTLAIGFFLFYAWNLTYKRARKPQQGETPAETGQEKRAGP
jgi:hypothetical protein